jgi:MoaD family protein
MAQIRVRYFGALRDIVGKREEHVSIADELNISGLVKKLSEIHGKRFAEFVFDPKGKLRQGFAYAINGDSVSETKLRRTKCKDVTEFAVLPPISGGDS